MSIYSNYDKDDIIEELFDFTDALRDQDLLDTDEEDMLDDLREQYYKVCQGQV